MDGTVLNMKLALGFFHFIDLPRIMLKLNDLNKADADPLTTNTHMKYDMLISALHPLWMSEIRARPFPYPLKVS
jgi:hypothetical protein